MICRFPGERLARLVFSAMIITFIPNEAALTCPSRMTTLFFSATLFFAILRKARGICQPVAVDRGARDN